MLSSLCHSFPLTSNTDAVFVSVIPVSTCVFSDLPVLLDRYKRAMISKHELKIKEGSLILILLTSQPFYIKRQENAARPIL